LRGNKYYSGVVKRRRAI